MLRVGLTGGIASGKTTACSIFSELGVPVIDADTISHQLVARGKPALEEIKKSFGNTILNKSGELDRDIMRNIIFNNRKARKKLENILHPLVYREIEKMVNKLTNPYCIICIPLLLETKWGDKVDRILVIDVPENIQVERAALRDRNNNMDIQKIIHTQVSRQDRLEAADDIIINDGDIENLRNRINELNDKYNNLSAVSKSNYTGIN